MNIFPKFFEQKRPTLKRGNIPNFEDVSEFVIWFIKNEPIVNALSNRSINDFFNEGYRPKFESYNNPEAVGLNIGSLQVWFVVKLFIDLNILKDDDINRFGQFINDLDKAGMETLLTAGELAFKYKLILKTHTYEKEIEKIPEGVERELYKLNSLSDDVIAAEIRILAWLYHEYFNEWWTPPKHKQSEIDIEQARLLIKLGKYEEGIKIYEAVLETNPQNCEALNDKGFVLCQLEKYEEVIEACNKLLEINQNHLDALNNKGLALLKLGKNEEAIEVCNKLLEIDPQNQLTLNRRGFALSLLGKYEEAIEMYNRVLEINPEDQDTLNRKGFALSQLGRYEEIGETCNKVLEKNPENYTAQEGKGFVLFKLGKYEEAIDMFNGELEINPKNCVALLRKGFALSRLGKYEKAIDTFDRVLEINPEDHDAFINKGLSLFELEKYKEAIEMFNRVLKINPEDRDALYNKGVALFKLEEDEEAIKVYDQILKINPEDQAALYNKGGVLIALEKYEEAIEMFDEVLKINPEDGDSLYAKKSAYKLGELKEEKTLNNAKNDLAAGNIDFNTFLEQMAATRYHYNESDVFCNDQMQQVFNKFRFNRDELKEIIEELESLNSGYVVKMVESDPEIMEYYLKLKESGNPSLVICEKLRLRLGAL